jgi:6-phospho-beta-glucosidase
MCRMRLAVLGGGGFRVPLLHRALLADAANGTGLVDELVLVDPDRGRLAAVLAVLDHQHAAAGGGAPLTVRTTTDVEAGLRGADAIFSAIRVGGLAGRVVDEQVARREGVIGQETVGAGGISYALRTIPVVRRLAEKIAMAAPDAWVVNFTNPAGVVTEVMTAVLGERVVGICDSPEGLCRRAARAAGVEREDVQYDYVGINHLGWLRGMRLDGVDRLPGLLANPVAVESFEEGALFGAAWLQALGAIPNEYLHYYYFAREVFAADQGPGRGSMLLGQQQEFYARASDQPEIAANAWHAALVAREQTYLAENRRAVHAGPRAQTDVDTGGYTGVALAVLRAVLLGRQARLIVDVPNQGAIPGLADESIVEVPCVVDETGARPLPAAPLSSHQAGLVHAVKACEADAITAALTGSRRFALRSLAEHPLVDSVAVARRLLDGYLAAIPGLAEILPRP